MSREARGLEEIDQVRDSAGRDRWAASSFRKEGGGPGEPLGDLRSVELWG